MESSSFFVLRRCGMRVMQAAMLVVLLLGVSQLQAQSFTDATNVPGVSLSASATSLLEDGRQLEKQQRWTDALQHYEDAVRKFPSHEDLKLRHTLAQIHCELDRRFTDRSFHELIQNANQDQTLDVYNEIGLKVYNHYYQTPDWQRLTWRGTANLDVAITKAEFRRRYIPNVTEAQIKAFRGELRRDVNKRAVRTHNDAVNLVNYSAQLAQKRLRLNPVVAIMEYCCGAISALDQYSTYLTGAQLDDVYNQIEGNFVGLGVELKSDDNALLIVNVIRDGPAFHAGVHEGDRIVAVDGRKTSDISTDAAADMLKGEQGTSVGITLLTRDGQQRVAQVTRERVNVPCVENVEILDHDRGIAYFRLTSFQKTTSRDVDTALWRLHREGMKTLIVDVRGNPGGLLTASVEVADKFLYDGTIVATRGRNKHEDYDYKAHRVATWGVPLIVLIDHETASASEIFAGAIRDHGRGTVIGETSYGKGSVQGIFPLSSFRAGIRLTTARFFTPKGHPISGRGVIPHQVVSQKQVHTLARPIGDGTLLDNEEADPVLFAALESARQLNVAASR
jgi:carboxyl-terminal processing protease